MSQSTSDGFIPSNFSCLDRFLSGGIPRGHVTLMYGESNAGKTTLAIQCAISCAKKGLRTLFVDADHTFSSTRLSQMALNDLDLVASSIMILRPESFEEQCTLIERLNGYVAKSFGLVAVDTITSLYQAELAGEEGGFALNRRLSRQLAYLMRVARVNGVAVLLASRVHTIPVESGGIERIEPVATRVLRYWSENILRLNVANKTPIREAWVEKLSGKKVTGLLCRLMLSDVGVVDIEE